MTMQRVSFTEENVVESGIDRFQPEAGNKYRIVLMDDGPLWTARHWIKADGDVSTPYLCLGDPAAIWNEGKRGGKDPDNCPACRFAKRGRNTSVRQVEIAFGINIAVYQTNKNGDKPRGGQLFVNGLPWAMSMRSYNLLCERGSSRNGLTKQDILVLPEERGGFTQLDFDVPPVSWFADNEPVLEQLKNLNTEKLSDEDLRNMLGNAVEEDELLDLIQAAGVDTSEYQPTLATASPQGSEGNKSGW